MFRVFFPAKRIGTAVDKSSSYGAQQALTDGEVSVYMFAGTDTAHNAHAIGYTDSSADPTAKKTAGHCFDNAAPSYHAMHGGLSFLVKKGDYWKVVLNGTPTTLTVTWTPITER